VSTNDPSTDVVSASENTALREMVRTLKVQTDMGAGDGNDFVLDLMESILNAKDENEVFELQESGMMSGKDFTGRPFVVRQEDIEWKQASAAYVSEGAFPFYAIIRATELAAARRS
jgi:hypothetical protein